MFKHGPARQSKPQTAKASALENPCAPSQALTSYLLEKNAIPFMVFERTK
jgi:hypothetical protein